MAKQSSKTTTDHEEIRRWAEERGGHPASVRDTASEGDPGILRIDFEDVGAGEDELEPISWEDFFEKFEEQELAFLYQETTSSGGESRFFKLVRRDAQ